MSLGHTIWGVMCGPSCGDKVKIILEFWSWFSAEQTDVLSYRPVGTDRVNELRLTLLALAMVATAECIESSQSL